MENLFKLLLVLFASLAVMVFLLERSGSTISPEKQASIARWILPLLALLVVIRMFQHYMG